jgi:rhamnogalacturonan endolyase
VAVTVVLRPPGRRDGASCEVLFTSSNNGGVEGPGRGVAADIDPDNPGAEAWTNAAGLWAASSRGTTTESLTAVGSRPGTCNFAVWWDADLSRELLNSNAVSDHDGQGGGFTASGCSANNGSKSTPSLSADVIGDWREEVIWRCGTTIRVYTTTALSTDRMYTLMHDPQYRVAIAWQNSAYNQPPHPSFHLGGGMAAPPNPDIHVR